MEVVSAAGLAVVETLKQDTLVSSVLGSCFTAVNVSKDLQSNKVGSTRCTRLTGGVNTQACVCMYVRTYIFTYMRTAYIHTYIHTCVRTYARTYVRTYMHKHVNTYIHMTIYIGICICCIYTCKDVYTCV